MQYWDTSALLKLFVPEADSSLFAAHLAQSAICISQVGQAEMMRAMARKEAEGAIPAMSAEAAFGQFLADVSAGRIAIVPFDARIEAHFRTLVLQFHRCRPPVVVRTLDAIHLATAHLLATDEVVSTDGHMRAGASALGLKLFP
jgi:predicted nucleic acid-binding protein